MRQAETAECGLAALASLMGAYGVTVPLDRLRKLAASTVYGTSITMLDRIAIQLGFEARPRRVHEIDDLAALVPCLVHLNFIHFAVLERMTRNHMVLADPLAGIVRMPRDRFSRAFTGMALTIRPTRFTRISVPGSKPRLRDLLTGAPGRSATALGLAAGAAAAWAASLAMAGRVFDGVGSPLAIAVALPGAVALTVLAARLALSGPAALAARARRHSVAHVAGQPTAAFAQRSPVQAQATLDAAPRLIDERLTAAWLGTVAASVLLASAALLAPLLAAWGTVLILLTGATGGTIVRARGAPVAQVEYQPMPVVVPPPGAIAQADGWRIGAGAQEIFATTAGTHAWRAAGIVPEAERGAILAGVIAAGFGLLVLATAALAAALMAAGAAPGRTFAAALLVLGAGRTIPSILAGLRLPFVTAVQHRLADRSTAVAAAEPSPPVAGEALRLTGVAWRPAQLLPERVRGIDLAIPVGGSLAVIAAPRAGSTLIARLAAGWLAPTRGTVAVRAPILLGTEWVLGAGTLRDVIAMGEPIDANDLDDVFAALELAGPLAARGGLGLRVSDDARELSGGQRRRVMLAAALLRRPGLLVLDGTLQALGTAGAARVLALAKTRGSAVLLTSHRADIAALCDAHYRLDDPA